ncbi:glucooligosaccharide oxidase [Metarhizium guizhouense ARSEF 977]|uniref:Glucooligosaccharide oxidase n=1 Tax=Metarhizium guizhouense (strain ARSEF 977) TaxID=1276136 RepID=A0A0B4GEU3_METGA|nr:glucooligosaccharide oxidase [Metarhizium guizhouense ARSEF 977]
MLANGTGVHCSANENADLFWAVREAGSSFGIVAEFELRIFEAPQSLTLFAIDVFRDKTQAVEGFGMFQDLAMTAPRALNFWPAISGTSQRIQGVWLGDLAGLDNTLWLTVKNSSRHLRIFGDSIMNALADGDWGMHPDYIDTQLDVDTAQKLCWEGTIKRSSSALQGRSDVGDHGTSLVLNNLV